MTISQHDAQAGECSQQLCEGLEVEMPVDEKLRAAELRGQIVLAPEALRGASEYSLGADAVAAHAIIGKLP